MKIAICGCSLSAPSTDKPPHYKKFLNTHFSELLKKDYKVINFAKAGVSNYYIRYQVEEAIKQSPDVVILTPTNTARLELNINPDLKNGKYIGSIDEVKNSNIVSVHESAINNLDVPRSYKKAMGYYFKNIYNQEWERKKQVWVINDAINELQYNKIPCIFQPGFLIGDSASNYLYTEDESLEYFYNLYGFTIPYNDSLSKISITSKHDWLPNDPGYHTTVESQHIFYRYLVEKALLKINNTYRTGIIAQ